MPESTVLKMTPRSESIWSHEYIHSFAIPPMLQPVIAYQNIIPGALLLLIGIILQMPEIPHIRVKFPVLTVCKSRRYRVFHLEAFKIKPYSIFHLSATGDLTSYTNFHKIANRCRAIRALNSAHIDGFTHCLS